MYALLLLSGFVVSLTHVFLVWKNRGGARYSISEHAIADRNSYLIYLSAHIVTDILFLFYAYEFFYIAQDQGWLFGLTIVFIALDALQAVLPSRGRTESLHFVSAYTSWFLYQLVGVLSLLLLDIAQPYMMTASIVLLIVLTMFGYMHVRREKLWPLQLLMVPLYFVFLILVVIGSTA